MKKSKIPAIGRLALSIWEAREHEAVLSGLLAAALQESPTFALAFARAALPSFRSKSTDIPVVQQFTVANAPRNVEDEEEEQSKEGRIDVLFAAGQQVFLVEVKAKPLTGSDVQKFVDQIRGYERLLGPVLEADAELEDDSLNAIRKRWSGKPVLVGVTGSSSKDLEPKTQKAIRGIQWVSWKEVRALLQAEGGQGLSARALLALLEHPPVSQKLSITVPVEAYRVSRIVRQAHFDKGLKPLLPPLVRRLHDEHWDKRYIASPHTSNDENGACAEVGAWTRWVHGKPVPLYLELRHLPSTAGEAAETRWAWAVPFEPVRRSAAWARTAASEALADAGDIFPRKASRQRHRLRLGRDPLEDGSPLWLLLESADVTRAVQATGTYARCRDALADISDAKGTDELVRLFWELVTRTLLEHHPKARKSGRKVSA